MERRLGAVGLLAAHCAKCCGTPLSRCFLCPWEFLWGQWPKIFWYGDALTVVKDLPGPICDSAKVLVVLMMVSTKKGLLATIATCRSSLSFPSEKASNARRLSQDPGAQGLGWLCSVFLALYVPFAVSVQRRACPLGRYRNGLVFLQLDALPLCHPGSPCF